MVIGSEKPSRHIPSICDRDTAPSNRHLVRSGVAHRAPPLIINLRRGDVLVVEKVLDRFNRHAGIQQQGRRRRPQRMRRVNALLMYRKNKNPFQK